MSTSKLSNVISHGFVPLLQLDDDTPGEVVAALHASFRIVLSASNSQSFDRYVSIRLTEALKRDLGQLAMPTDRRMKTGLDELDRLIAMRYFNDGNYCFPSCQLGVLTFTQDGIVGELSASIYERAFADCAIWLFHNVYRNARTSGRNTWFAFGKVQERTQQSPLILMDKLH